MAASKSSMCLCRLFSLPKTGTKPLLKLVNNGKICQTSPVLRNFSSRNAGDSFISSILPAINFKLGSVSSIYSSASKAKKYHHPFEPWSTTLTCPFSSKKSQSDVKGLADQILREKLENESTGSTDGSNRSSSQESEEEKAKEERQREEKRRADEFQKKMMKYTFISFGAIFTGLAGFIVHEWGSPIRDQDDNIIPDEFSNLPSWKAYLKRAYREMMYYDKMIKDPSREKLLPEPLTEPYYQPPYTLVLEMTGILIHPEWTYQTGWRFKKRPGVDFFLQQIGPPLFEVVIYTAEQGLTAFPILDTLDPNGYIMYRLFRDATRYMKGHHVKDLSCLNRDLSKVIYIDWDSTSFQLQPENAIKLQKWKGNDDDRSLLDLAMFLRTIATSGVEDVRSVLQFYSQFDDPLEAFKENQRKLAEQAEQQRLLDESRDKQALTSAWKGGVFRRR